MRKKVLTGVVLAAFWVLSLTGNVVAATYSVPGDFSSIQEAYNTVADGDVIMVERGIYYENLTFNAKSVTLKSTGGATQTVIDGGKKGPVLNIVSMLTQTEVGVNYPGSIVIEGFTIQNGVGLAAGNWSNMTLGAAGGINAVGTVHPTVNNCIITNNSGDNFGGAINAYGPSVSYYASVILNNSTVTNNSATYGGAAWAYMNSGVHFYNCNVTNNKAVTAGGAFYTGYLGTIRAESSFISGNTANEGGAAYVASYNGGIVFNNSVIDLNSAETAGGAVYIASGLFGGTHNTITHNSAPVGGSIYKAGGYMSYLTNTIVYGNSSLPYLPDSSYLGSIYGCIIEGGAPGVPDMSIDPNGNLDVDPKFVNADARNYRLAAGSPAIDRVTSWGVGNDILGVARPQGLSYDIGAYEVFVPDTTKPVSSATITGVTGANGFFTSDVTIDLASQDNIAVKEVHYTVNGIETIVPGGAASIPLTIDGTYSISYYAVDTSGNTEDAQSTIIKVDKTAPAVTSSSPSKNATGVSTSASVIITFSENILQGSAFSNITLKKGSSTVSSTKTISGNKLTIKPSNSMSSSTTYTVTIPASAVKDSAGNIVAQYSFSFKTK